MANVSYQSVSSSNVTAVGYDADTMTLYVRFTNGSEYAYDSVPVDEYESLLSAPSAGSALNNSIKGVYSHRRV